MKYYMPTKWINLELDKFLEIYNLPALNQEEIKNLNQSTMSKKSPETDGFSG